MRNCYEPFIAYEKHKNGIVLEWCQWLKKIFNHFDQYYDKLDYITYSDLEYMTLNLNTLRHPYQYLIIDEFQDISKTQFEIIRRVVNNDFTKMFAVGDIKQAIYGFRGGEISVFQDCANRISKELELKNNYRSAQNIVNFNNYFFSDIFQQGIGFEGKAKLEMPAPHQGVPSNKEATSLGNVIALSKEITTEEKLRNQDVNFLEAQEIINILKNNHEGTTCILYKKLAPSLELLKQMLDKGMSFTAQVKIPMDEEPILTIFYHLMEGHLDKDHLDHRKEETIQSTLFLINRIFRYLHLKSTLDSEKLKKFYSLVDQFGPYHAYSKLLFEQGISSSHAEGSGLSFLKSLLELCYDDLERCYVYFKRIKNDSFSFEFQNGHTPQKIQIMTVHAAKGLEFDRIILAGIHSNGRQRIPCSNFGKYPGSFRWKESRKQKKFHKSPLFFLEEWEQKHKDSAEDKRLLYVAATRAKNELLWIDFRFPEKLYSAPRQSWIHAFHSNLLDITKNLIRHHELPIGQKMLHKDDNKRPFFHQNPLGILPAGEGEALLLGELSVTALSMLAQCPRKFYLSNILKIPSDTAPTLQTQEKSPSSAARGSKIHLAISQMIQQNLPPSTSILQWVKEQLQPYPGPLMSEKSMKFPLFGLMISGTPDLVIKHDENMMIWDFKTGAKREDNKHYWLQLKLYAMGLWELGSVEQNRPLELCLLYLDEREKVSRSINFKQTKEEVFSLWRSANSLHQVNRSHCASCAFGKLCRF